MEGARYAKRMLKAAITLFSFDFSGSGHSDGEYVSLGWWEREDLKVVVEYLRAGGRTSTIGLWGRSMGAVTALLHADRDPSIAGLVLDSPFSDINKLADELYRKYQGAPGLMYSLGQWMIKKSIRSRANFEMDALNPMQHVDKAFIPALFIVAKGDDFILPAHGLALHAKYAGDKNLIQVEGDHNSARPTSALDSVFIFFYNTLQIKTLLPTVAAEIENLGSVHAPVQDVPIPSAIPQEYLPDDSEGSEDELFRQVMQMSIESAKQEEEKRKVQSPAPASAPGSSPSPSSPPPPPSQPPMPGAQSAPAAKPVPRPSPSAPPKK